MAHSAATPLLAKPLFLDFILIHALKSMEASLHPPRKL
jgi:hypothetical protein